MRPAATLKPEFQHPIEFGACSGPQSRISGPPVNCTLKSRTDGRTTDGRGPGGAEPGQPAGRIPGTPESRHVTMAWMWRKIVVKGASGSGKSTFAAALAERLNLPHIELDALNHGPGWTQATPAELRARLVAALSGLDGWIVDG